MVQGATSILLVEDDNDVAGLIIDHVERAMKVRVTHVHSAAEAVRENTAEPRDVVLADVSLPDRDDLSLARELRRATDSEVVLMTEAPTLGRAIEAMRLGVRDIFTKPFDLVRLTNSLHEAADARRHRRLEQARYDRLRRVSARIIRERRTLQQRVELVCRDLVGAYRRLAEKVVAQQGESD
jgi:DNA-binding NtrC family response regulator